MRFVAVLEQDARQLLLREAVQELGRGGPLGGVEAHVERLVALEGKAARRLIELVGGEAQVQEHGVRFGHARGARVGGEVPEASLREHHAIAEAGQPLPGARQRLGIVIEPEEPRSGPRALQQSLSVSTHANRPVHDPAPATGAQEERHLVHQHREVRHPLPLHAASDSLARQPLEQIVERSIVIALEVRPPLRIPHLELVRQADDEHVLHEPHALAVVGRDLDASLRIERDVLRERDVRVLDSAPIGIESRQRIHSLLERVPELERMHFERIAAGHDDDLVAVAIRQGFPELRRDAEPPLRIDRVLEMPPKHRLPLRGKLPSLSS